MAVQHPAIASKVRPIHGETTSAYAARAESAFHQIEQALRRLANAQGKAVVKSSNTIAQTGPDPWFSIPSAVTLTIDPAESSRQFIDLTHNATAALAPAYAEDGQLTLLIRLGATPRQITWGPEWGLQYEAQVEQTPNTYTMYTWEFIAGLPYLKSFLTGIPLPPP